TTTASNSNVPSARLSAPRWSATPPAWGCRGRPRCFDNLSTPHQRPGATRGLAAPGTPPSRPGTRRFQDVCNHPLQRRNPARTEPAAEAPHTSVKATLTGVCGQRLIGVNLPPDRTGRATLVLSTPVT